MYVCKIMRFLFVCFSIGSAVKFIGRRLGIKYMEKILAKLANSGTVLLKSGFPSPVIQAGTSLGGR